MTKIDAQHALPTGAWQLDPGQTAVTVTAKKMGMITVPATFDVVSSTIEIDADHQVTGVEVVVDAGSYKSSNAKRDQHIRSADFLDAENHSDLVFKADGVASTSNGYRADGSLTIKGRTFPVSIDIRELDFDSGRGSFRASAAVDRKAIGVGKLPSFVIGRSLELSVTATAAPASA